MTSPATSVDGTRTVTSADGTRIAFERFGDGDPVIVVPGILCTREAVRAHGEQLAEKFSAIIYDRRGRGGSTDTLPYVVDREIEDLEALIKEAGGSAMVYGHSSGAGLVLNAAARGLPITRLVLHEPPYGPDDEESRSGARQIGEAVATHIAEDRRADAIRLFLAGAGMPEEMAEQAAQDPGMLAVAPTMPYDFEVMGNASTGGVIPEDDVRRLSMPTLVLAGSASPPFFLDTAERITELLPDGRYIVLEGADHAAPADVVVPPVAEFFTA